MFNLKWLWSLAPLPLMYLARSVRRDPQFGGKPKGDYLKRLKASPNWKRGGFRNIDRTPIQEDFGSLLGDLYGYIRASDTFPDEPLPVLQDDPDFRPDPGEIYFTWYGHSALRMEAVDQTILLDPMLGPWVAPVPFLGQRFPYQFALPPKSFDRIDLIIFSHDHYDHLDMETVQQLAPATEHFLVPLGVGVHLMRWGVAANKISEIDWWESYERDGIEYTFTPSRHFGGRSPASRNRSLWGGFSIKIGDRKIYFGGDSGYGSHFSTIGEKLGPFELTMLDCAQYHDRWQNVHMQPEEAIQATKDLRAQQLLPIHWAGFSLSDHPWYDPIERLLTASESKDTILTPCIGERFRLGQKTFRHDCWWEQAIDKT